ncbi:MAG TPA: rRNA maturation RNase YbeY [Candidatus Polarisedimenticolaceae bacterium]|nr:rRNA maturation RNase YbeY [Candidatus Polarisedimenticolaceae bacterium]
MQVEVVDAQRRHPVGARALARFVRRVASCAPKTPCDEVAILLCGDRRMRALNARFRGKDKTTDVLSFPASCVRGADGRRPLGDIVISMPQAARQAHRARHGVEREVRLLLLHGYLHLLGYDHEVDDGTMRRLENRLARRLFRASR